MAPGQGLPVIVKDIPQSDGIGEKTRGRKNAIGPGQFEGNDVHRPQRQGGIGFQRGGEVELAGRLYHRIQADAHGQIHGGAVDRPRQGFP